MTRADKDKPVVLSRIYTRTGDDGTTTLSDLSRTSKTDSRLAAYADVEEANAHLGLAMSHGTLSADLVAVLVRVQNELFDLGADLATPIAENPEFPPLRVEQSYVDWLEEQCDRFNEDLKPLRSFILPGGDPATAALHLARVTVRRAERTTWAALQTHEDMNPLTARYLNRLSDLLFILCRVAHAGSEILWKPGGTR
ncbi:cob(I)yrinic acid a,c-diamide adenosyltransferase [Nonomuraea glycinis]|uniref:Corrinoid adenosyltransferase n=1 Tax=Nonomuraea glycinis TaxID=2047744 RepID=A0A918A4S2_9ACTN|nr:cob(I)yrinic acid a,c-diamide adenosyltransferase [Nonomuraea glycinis]MCA2175545.1 cob(I)yrinic acid a,c-diamide adenosyltransferase [Nonomuraea glycinis]WSG72155.1 cob(I)yrinic acid a,c-diamide adenosyltransferase [Nonomuraea glycinis]GGP04892.1 cob(I)yrinic acid a,c-diamide adenosyltransferase [Nonomuraea glycinis]